MITDWLTVDTLEEYIKYCGENWDTPIAIVKRSYSPTPDVVGLTFYLIDNEGEYHYSMGSDPDANNWSTFPDEPFPDYIKDMILGWLPFDFNKYAEFINRPRCNLCGKYSEDATDWIELLNSKICPECLKKPCCDTCATRCKRDSHDFTYTNCGVMTGAYRMWTPHKHHDIPIDETPKTYEEYLKEYNIYTKNI